MILARALVALLVEALGALLRFLLILLGVHAAPATAALDFSQPDPVFL